MKSCDTRRSTTRHLNTTLLIHAALLGAAFMFFAPAPSWAQKESGTSCTDCHDAEDTDDPKSLFLQQVSLSVHRSVGCRDCHAEISVEAPDASPGHPHGAKITKVDCGECHEDEAETYVRHGRLEVGSNGDLPSCSSCHGTHDILHSSDQKSKVHPLNLPATCSICHTNTDLIKHHDVLRDEPIKRFASSVHGRATKGGMFMAATCSDCHSAAMGDTHRSAHRILNAADPESPSNHFNIPNTCGRCHAGTAADYWAGIHGQLLKRGDLSSPICTDCHGEHGILPVSDLRSPASPARVAEATCTRCHESEMLNERFGLPTGRMRSYVDSYHGLKRKAGSGAVANCASCHGTHKILPHDDAQSSINKENLPNTCGNCHPGISTVIATTPIHTTGTGVYAGWPHFFKILYYWLIGLTIGGMLLHNIAHWLRHVLMLRKLPQVRRMDPGETGQHWVLMISFIVLVITGFALRFSEAWWVHALFGWGGGEGFMLRGLIHRVAAVIFIIWTIWHLAYLCTHRGRRWLFDMIWGWRDFRNIGENASFFLGRTEKQPTFGRFTYMEKCEYWALMWGTFIMIGTGVFLWFDNWFAVNFKLPSGLLTVMQVVHYYEAWLATLAILVWHIYGTVFSPSVYPMNPSWWSGRMPKAMYEHEHPEAPKLPEEAPRA